LLPRNIFHHNYSVLSNNLISGRNFSFKPFGHIHVSDRGENTGPRSRNCKGYPPF